MRIGRWESGAWSDAGDDVAAEEPLQLILDGDPLSVIMRTPGNDIELAIGLLHAERVITSLDDVARLHISAETHEAATAYAAGVNAVFPPGTPTTSVIQAVRGLARPHEAAASR